MSTIVFFPFFSVLTFLLLEREQGNVVVVLIGQAEPCFSASKYKKTIVKKTKNKKSKKIAPECQLLFPSFTSTGTASFYTDHVPVGMLCTGTVQMICCTY